MLLFLFVLGLAAGSFLNVLIDRLPKEENVIAGRSYCDHCKKKIRWYDLIPVFSFFLLKGNCRYCHSPLSIYYPAVELVTGIMFVLTFFLLFTSEESFGHLRGGYLDFVTMIFYLFIITSLIVIFFTDLKYGIIPDKIVYPAISVSLLFLISQYPNILISHVISGIGAFLFFLALFLITKGKGMGFGDVKLSFLMGLVLGFPNIAIALYISFLTGAVWGCILILWKRKKLLGTKIPFGPFLVFGTLVTMFFGEQIKELIQWVLRLSNY